jgi:hypothetical protein
MGSEILRSESKENAPTSSTEVEFALVLSRMIDSVNNDPEHLRATVYELARVKLKEQFGSDKFVDMGQLSNSLEIAIRGVEMFVKKNGDNPALSAPAAAQGQPILAAPAAETISRPAARVVDVWGERRNFGFTAHWRFAAVIAIGLAAVIVIKQHVVGVDALRKGVDRVVNLRSSSTQKFAQSALAQKKVETADRAPGEPSPLIPTAFGIYAVSQDKLYELELLPGRAPDIRVAVSPAILRPSRTTLPDGHLKFIVYRRDSATNAADHAEIRVVAKIAQEMNFDKSGKPVMSKIDDTWVIRNIAIPFRTAPKKDDPDMYEVQSESPENALVPGRYALVIKGQAYDFSVAGEVTDPRQCLERMAATNGQFYSECQKP